MAKGVNDSAVRVYEAKVNQKIEMLRYHPKYDALREDVNYALNVRKGFGLDAIVADVYCDLFVNEPVSVIADWLNTVKL
jgi:hypothetical protein